MPQVHGSDAVVMINGSDLSPYTKSTEDTDTTEAHDTTTYGPVKRKRYAAGLADGTVTIGGVYESGVTGPGQILKPLKAARAVVTFVERPEGTGSGLPEDSCGVIITTYKQSLPVDDMITWEAELQKSGALTTGTQP